MVPCRLPPRQTRTPVAVVPDLGAGAPFRLAPFSAGTVWNDAPTRTITTRGDVALLARGLHLCSRMLLPFVIVPALLVLHGVFRDLFPAARAALLDPGRVLFGFFDGLDLSGQYGPVPAVLPMLSVPVLLLPSIAWFPFSAPIPVSPSIRSLSATTHPISAP